MEKKIVVLIPNAQRYKLKYRKSNGETKDYTISAPIEQTKESFTVCAFGSGVRTFKFENIEDIE